MRCYSRSKCSPGIPNAFGAVGRITKERCSSRHRHVYPPGKPSRIPIIAVTVQMEKQQHTTDRAHCKNNGFKVGFTTSDGIYVQNHMLEKGDTTGPISTEFILKDPTVEFAVLETARGGILRAGLDSPVAIFGIITNIQEDHLGLMTLTI